MIDLVSSILPPNPPFLPYYFRANSRGCIIKSLIIPAQYIFRHSLCQSLCLHEEYNDEWDIIFVFKELQLSEEIID